MKKIEGYTYFFWNSKETGKFGRKSEVRRFYCFFFFWSREEILIDRIGERSLTHLIFKFNVIESLNKSVKCILMEEMQTKQHWRKQS